MKAVVASLLALCAVFLLAAGCSSNYLSTRPFELRACRGDLGRMPVVATAARLVRALEKRGWDIEEVSPTADHVFASVCYRHRRPCVTIDARVDPSGEVAIFREEPQGKIRKKHAKIIKRWMHNLRATYRGLSCRTHDRQTEQFMRRFDVRAGRPQQGR